MSDLETILDERQSRRQALKTYAPPTITVIGLATVGTLATSGPGGAGGNGRGQRRGGEKHAGGQK